MTPNASGAPPAAPREGPAARRPSFRRSLRDSGLPDDYLEALDAKRRQLDDSIWKYIASKEREYKNYEKELRHQRRAAQGQDGEASGLGNGNGHVGRRRRSSDEKEKTGGEASRQSSSAIVDSAEEQGGMAREARQTMDRSSIAGLKDRRASLERDKEFVGVFTPAYLAALSDESRNTSTGLERSSSNPERLSNTAASELPPGSIERTSSDTVIHTKKPSRPSQLVLQHRTSSSGSSADGRLASAMKSPTHRPKRKRVSLAVGDAIVAPSDNVPSSLSTHSTPSHSRIRQATPQQHPTPASPSEDVSTASRSTSVSAAIVEAEQTTLANARTLDESEHAILGSPMIDKTDFAPMPKAVSSKSRIDPDGDLFDLEGEEDSELPPPILDDDDLDDAMEDQEEAGASAEPASASATSSPVFTPPSGERYDPTTGMIPEPEGGKEDSAVPYLPSSAVTSQMPSKPGFRRPSVIHDPVYRGPGYVEAEQEAVEDETYGSSFVRPSTKGSFTSGSLGESFMEKNAEQMMKLREERQQRTAQVRS